MSSKRLMDKKEKGKEERSMDEHKGKEKEALGVNEALSDFKIDLNDETHGSVEVKLVELLNDDRNYERWLGSCPKMLDYLGKELTPDFVMKNSKETMQKRKVSESLDCSASELDTFRQLWENEVRVGEIGSKTDSKIIEEYFKASGLASNYQPYASGSENLAVFAVSFPNALSFGAFVLDDDDGGLVPIFSCFHDSHDVGSLAENATGGDWKWDRISSPWFEKLFNDSLENMSLADVVKSKVKSGSILVDTYTGQLLGFHKTIPFNRVSGTIRCDPITGRIEEFMVVMEYEKIEKNKIHTQLKLMIDDYKGFSEKYKAEIGTIRHEQMEEIQKYAGTDEPEEVFAKLEQCAEQFRDGEWVDKCEKVEKEIEE